MILNKKVKLIFNKIKERFEDAGKIEPTTPTKTLQCVSVCVEVLNTKTLHHFFSPISF